MISSPHRAGLRFRNDEPATTVGAGTWLGLIRDLATNRRNGGPSSSSRTSVRHPGKPLAPVPVEVPAFPEAAADLARHPYAEPIERLLAVDLPAVLTPPPGRRLVLNPAPVGELENPFWWRETS